MLAALLQEQREISLQARNLPPELDQAYHQRVAMSSAAAQGASKFLDALRRRPGGNSPLGCAEAGTDPRLIAVGIRGRQWYNRLSSILEVEGSRVQRTPDGRKRARLRGA